MAFFHCSHDVSCSWSVPSVSPLAELSLPVSTRLPQQSICVCSSPSLFSHLSSCDFHLGFALARCSTLMQPPPSTAGARCPALSMADPFLSSLSAHAMGSCTSHGTWETPREHLANPTAEFPLGTVTFQSLPQTVGLYLQSAFYPYEGL